MGCCIALRCSVVVVGRFRLIIARQAGCTGWYQPRVGLHAIIMIEKMDIIGEVSSSVSRF
jgi:hypothetical protein